MTVLICYSDSHCDNVGGGGGGGRVQGWGLVLRGGCGDKIRIIDRETSAVAIGEAEIGLLTA